VLNLSTHGGMARLSWPGWLDRMPANGHPSQYSPGSASSNFVFATTDVASRLSFYYCWGDRRRPAGSRWPRRRLCRLRSASSP